MESHNQQCALFSCDLPSFPCACMLSSIHHIWNYVLEYEKKWYACTNLFYQRIPSSSICSSQVLRPTSYGKWVGGPMSLKQGNFSFRARTAHNWLRMGEYGTYLEFCRSEEAPRHCQTSDSPTQSCARAHFRSPPGRPQVAPRSPPVWLHCISVTDFFQTVNPYFIAMAIKLGANWGLTGG